MEEERFELVATPNSSWPSSSPPPLSFKISQEPITIGRNDLKISSFEVEKKLSRNQIQIWKDAKTNKIFIQRKGLNPSVLNNLVNFHHFSI